MKTAIFLLLLLFSVGSLEAQERKENALDKLIAFSNGDFNNIEQVQDDCDFFVHRYHACSIFPMQRTENIAWQYVEVYWEGQDTEPLYQKVIRYELLENGNVQREFFEIPNAADFVGIQDNEAKLQSINPETLEAQAGCGFELEWDGVAFEGKTMENHCHSNEGVGDYESYYFKYTKDSFLMMPQLLDQKGVVKWGHEKPYIMQRDVLTFGTLH